MQSPFSWENLSAVHETKGVTRVPLCVTDHYTQLYHLQFSQGIPLRLNCAVLNCHWICNVKQCAHGSCESIAHVWEGFTSDLLPQDLRTWWGCFNNEHHFHISIHLTVHFIFIWRTSLSSGTNLNYLRQGQTYNLWATATPPQWVVRVLWLCETTNGVVVHIYGWKKRPHYWLKWRICSSAIGRLQ